MNIRSGTLLAFLLVSMTSFSGFAKGWRNTYLSFELPDDWKCTLEHTEWVCRSEKVDAAKQAIIILTAKFVGPTDSFEAYTTHLNTPQANQFRSGTTIPSKVTYPPKQVQINNQPWVDGLHLGSEVPNYFTRYLATIAPIPNSTPPQKLAILFTASAHKDFYTKYSNDFYKAVMSLKVVASKELISNPGSGPVRPGSELIGGNINAAMGDIGGEALDGNANQGFSTQEMALGGAALLIVLAIYILIKRKRNS